MRRIAVVGSRTLTDYQFLKDVLDKELAEGSFVVVSGGAPKGADKMAIDYAKERKLFWKIFPADWDTYKKAAGMIRNKPLVESANKVIAFWDGTSKGTKDSIDHAKKLNKPLLIVRF